MRKTHIFTHQAVLLSCPWAEEMFPATHYLLINPNFHNFV